MPDSVLSVCFFLVLAIEIIGIINKNNGTSVGLDSLSFGIQPDLSWVKTVITHVRILLVFRVKINISDFCRKKKSLTEY